MNLITCSVGQVFSLARPQTIFVDPNFNLRYLQTGLNKVLYLKETIICTDDSLLAVAKNELHIVTE